MTKCTRASCRCHCMISSITYRGSFTGRSPAGRTKSVARSGSRKAARNDNGPAERSPAPPPPRHPVFWLLLLFHNRLCGIVKSLLPKIGGGEDEDEDEDDAAAVSGSSWLLLLLPKGGDDGVLPKGGDEDEDEDEVTAAIIVRSMRNAASNIGWLNTTTAAALFMAMAITDTYFNSWMNSFASVPPKMSR